MLTQTGKQNRSPEGENNHWVSSIALPPSLVVSLPVCLLRHQLRGPIEPPDHCFLEVESLLSLRAWLLHCDASYISPGLHVYLTQRQPPPRLCRIRRLLCGALWPQLCLGWLRLRHVGGRVRYAQRLPEHGSRSYIAGQIHVSGCALCGDWAPALVAVDAVPVVLFEVSPAGYRDSCWNLKGESTQRYVVRWIRERGSSRARRTQLLRVGRIDLDHLWAPVDDGAIEACREPPSLERRHEIFRPLLQPSKTITLSADRFRRIWGAFRNRDILRISDGGFPVEGFELFELGRWLELSPELACCEESWRLACEQDILEPVLAIWLVLWELWVLSSPSKH